MPEFRKKDRPQASASFDRVPPHNFEAEQAVVGAAMQSPKTLPFLADAVRVDHFYKDAHREVFSVISDFFADSRTVDVVTVSEELKRRGKLELVGGNAYLSSIIESVPTAANAQAYAKIVKEKAMQRELITVGSEMVTMAYEGTETVDAMLDRSESLLCKIGLDKASNEDCVAMNDLVHSAMEQIAELNKNKSHVTGLSSGFKTFDKYTAGLHPGELVIVAARPSMGKSSFVANIAEYAAVDCNVPVLFFSVEMSKESVVQRLIATRSRIDANKIRTGYWEKDDWTTLTATASELSKAPLFIDDVTSTLQELRARARRLKMQKNIGLIVIDYIQLLTMSGSSNDRRPESRQMEVTIISRSLKLLAKELGVPVIALSQLSREAEKREDHRPRLADLRESGAIEQDADLVVFLYRDEYYHPQKAESQGKAEIIIAKQRNGGLGTIDMSFVKEFMLFGELDKYHNG